MEQKEIDKSEQEKGFTSTDARAYGVIQFDVSEMAHRKDINKAYLELMRNIDQRPALSKEIATFRKYVPTILKAMKDMQHLNNGYQATLDRYEGKSKARQNKRWTPEEDMVLIDAVCDESSTILELSTMMGRSPSSIKTRVSQLVGLKRLSQEIAGRFTGQLDGVSVEGEIKGTVYKERTT